MLNKDDLKTVGTLAKDVLEIVGSIVVTGLVFGVIPKRKPTGSYSNAVDAIMSSRMWSGDKTKAVAALKNDGNSEYYSAVIRVANSSMYTGDKLETIIKMSEEEA